MRLAKTVACGAAALSLAVSGALAGEGSFGMNDSWSPSESAMAQEETYILLEPVDVTHVYEIDENRDGVTDSYLFLEESDSLATSEDAYSGSEPLAMSEGEGLEPDSLVLSERIDSEPSAGG